MAILIPLALCLGCLLLIIQVARKKPDPHHEFIIALLGERLGESNEVESAARRFSRAKAGYPLRGRGM